MEIYEPFLSDGFVSLKVTMPSLPQLKSYEIPELLNPLFSDTLPFSEKTSSGTSVLIQGVECGFVNVTFIYPQITG